MTGFVEYTTGDRSRGPQAESRGLKRGPLERASETGGAAAALQTDLLPRELVHGDACACEAGPGLGVPGDHEHLARGQGEHVAAKRGEPGNGAGDELDATGEERLAERDGDEGCVHEEDIA